MGKVVVITGNPGAGKSRYCLQLLEKARQEGMAAAGIISPAVFNSGVKTGFFTMDVKTGMQRICGTRTAPDEGTLGCWKMDPAVLEWGNMLLRESCPCDQLFIDELGPLEFRKQQGYTEAISVLQKGRYGIAYVVIRPACIPDFRRVIEEFEIFTIPEGSCITGLRI